MTSAGRPGGGGHGKAGKVSEVAGILWYKSVPNADKKGRGSKNLKNFRTSYKEAPQNKVFWVSMYGWELIS